MVFYHKKTAPSVPNSTRTTGGGSSNGLQTSMFSARAGKYSTRLTQNITTFAGILARFALAGNDDLARWLTKVLHDIGQLIAS